MGWSRSSAQMRICDPRWTNGNDSKVADASNARSLASATCAWRSSLEQAQAPGALGEPQVGVVVAQQQPVLGARGEHAVGLVDALGHQVVDQHADVGLVASQDKRRLAA